MKASNYLYGTLELTIKEQGQKLPSPEELSIFFDGFRVHTSKGNFDLYEDVNYDFNYSFDPIEGGYLIEFLVKGANWYQMENLDHDLDWEDDKLDITLDDVFEAEDIINQGTKAQIEEVVLDICDNDENSYNEPEYNIKVVGFIISEWIGENLRTFILTNSNPEYTLHIQEEIVYDNK